ncbi:hypothetical protein QVD17_05733 [Tagetes erecta]|uniref:Uncharacterized protein n=1 Tax=Tagetes erecta TaxID=13708 RepID=A0AAD8PAS9_TARER|nr:hypothetical protein QVD17_05733 [Tagetes erecta]
MEMIHKGQASRDEPKSKDRDSKAIGYFTRPPTAMADSSSSKFQNMIFYLEGFDLEIRCSDFFVYFPSFASFTAQTPKGSSSKPPPSGSWINPKQYFELSILDLVHEPFTHTSTFAKGWSVPRRFISNEMVMRSTLKRKNKLKISKCFSAAIGISGERFFLVLRGRVKKTDKMSKAEVNVLKMKGPKLSFENKNPALVELSSYKRSSNQYTNADLQHQQKKNHQKKKDSTMLLLLPLNRFTVMEK